MAGNDRLYAQTGDASMAPADAFVPVAKDDADLPDGICRALWAGTAGTVNLMQQDGTIRSNFPLMQGPNPVICKQVRPGGTASDIWAIY